MLDEEGGDGTAGEEAKEAEPEEGDDKEVEPEEDEGRKKGKVWTGRL